MTDSTQALRNAIESFIAKRELSPTGFGRAAVGNPSFVPALMRGRSPRLATADRALAFMGAEPVGPAFVREVEAFLAVTGVKPSMLGLETAGDPSFVTRLRAGASPRLKTVDRVRAWMAGHASAAERRAIGGAVSGRVPVAANTHEGADGMAVTDTLTLYMSGREAAAFLGLSPRTLDRYRVNGEGPAFHKFGSRVRYARADLEAWASARRRTSTSDVGEARRVSAR